LFFRFFIIFNLPLFFFMIYLCGGPFDVKWLWIRTVLRNGKFVFFLFFFFFWGHKENNRKLHSALIEYWIFTPLLKTTCIVMTVDLFSLHITIDDIDIVKIGKIGKTRYVNTKMKYKCYWQNVCSFLIDFVKYEF